MNFSKDEIQNGPMYVPDSLNLFAKLAGDMLKEKMAEMDPLVVSSNVL
ncbi:MAG: hypothetical protein ACLUR5_04080 [Eubacterium ventriosum]